MLSNNDLGVLRSVVPWNQQDKLNALIADAVGPGHRPPSAVGKLAVFAAPAGLWCASMGCVALAVKLSSLAVAIVGWSTGTILGVGAILLLIKRALCVADDGWTAYVAPRACRACERLAEENGRLRDALTAPGVTP